MAMDSSKNRIGRYRVLAELGQGGTSNVSLAVAEGPGDFQKLVVLKRMKPQLATEPSFSEMFMNEARLAARLNHPNIVQTNEVFRHEGLPVIVMEFLEGQTLAELTTRVGTAEGLTLAKRLHILSEALSGLEYSHVLTDYNGDPLNVVHRDMTPHNLFITFDGQVRVLDFGIAKLNGSSIETETGVIKGKLRYIPPEQIFGENVDRRADVYSVGVMLWEAATRQRMWRGLSEATVMNRVINGEIPSPRSVNDAVSPELEQLVMAALAPDLKERLSTAAELQRRVDEYRESLNEPVRARDIAQVVCTAFAERRKRTRALIDEQLQASGAADECAPVALQESMISPEGDYAVASAPRASKPRPKTQGWLLGGLAVAVAAAFLSWPAANAPPPPTTLPSATSGPAAGQSSSATLPDGTQRLGANPQPTLGAPSVQVPGRAHRSLAGTVAGRDVGLALSTGEKDRGLVAAGASTSSPATSATHERPGAGGRQTPRPVSTRQTRRHLEAPNPRTEQGNRQTRPDGCTPPFVIDARGIKRFKPECVR